MANTSRDATPRISKIIRVRYGRYFFSVKHGPFDHLQNARRHFVSGLLRDRSIGRSTKSRAGRADLIF